jgi:hypothetical protein
VNVTEVEAILETGAVLSDLHHLASVVLSLIDPDPVGTGLWIQQAAHKWMSENQTLFSN